jgi:hypothetical protein
MHREIADGQHLGEPADSKSEGYTPTEQPKSQHSACRAPGACKGGYLIVASSKVPRHVQEEDGSTMGGNRVRPSLAASLQIIPVLAV